MREQIDVGRVSAALPGYELGAELGRGGFGVVLAGRHRLIDRPVAVKVLLDPTEGGDVGDSDGGLRTRFLGEARVLAGLDHPHVVRIYDYVESDGLCLLVMEQLTGGSLRGRGRTLSAPASAGAIGVAAAVALAAAHSHGVLHRDIKPDNLLFTEDGTPKVADFGIAKIVEATAATTTGLVGTPRYMAPEQITGGRLGPGTDLYALGVVLYELLAGRSPFPPDLPVAALLHHHLSVAPLPLSEAPHPVAKVIISAMAKEPGWRPPTALDFAVRLAAATTASIGPGWLNASRVPVRLPDEVLAAAGHQPGTGPSSYDPGQGTPSGPGQRFPSGPGQWTPSGPGQQFPSGPGQQTPSGPGQQIMPDATVPNGSRWSGPDAGPNAPAPNAPAWNAAAPPAPGGPTRVDHRAPDHRPPDQWHPGGPAPIPRTALGPPSPTARAGRRHRPDNRRRLVIAAVAAVAVLALTVGLLIGLGGIGGGGDDKRLAAYGGAAVTYSGLEDAHALALAANGTLYVTDPGTEVGQGQVIQFTAEGKATRLGGSGPHPTPSVEPSPSPTPVLGDHGPSLAAELQQPVGVAVGPDGAIYLAETDAGRIRRIGTDGIITTIAGTGRDSSTGSVADKGDATRAYLDDPYAVAVDGKGVVYVTEGYRVRRIENGQISTVAGRQDESGSAGDGGPAVNATLSDPSGLALAHDGTLYVADAGSDTVRRIDRSGVISLVAGKQGTEGRRGDGGPATAAQLYNPRGLALGPDGSLYIADAGNNVIRRADAKGVINTVAGSGTYSSEQDARTLATQVPLSTPSGVVVDPSGALYIASAGDGTIRRVETDGFLTTVLTPPES
ncbi:serine/threonine-protein kinase [Frankia sp. AgB32]|uniref:serine/threonine-protein kinase n=1 Tax=Frankia sp. AgB32 TaxID=631119 RepID=UPI00200FC4BB|nr:serine/threonine-protein kinase [Frankia sp. AgB32]MCK9894365.1 protein kinase [Frankia sp. AgB32]